MTLVGFKARFATKVEDRSKRQTIRWGNRFKVGQRLQLYTGLRQKGARKLAAEDPVVVSVSAIEIIGAGVYVDGERMDNAGQVGLAMNDFPACERIHRLYYLAASVGLTAVGLALLGLLVASGRL